MNKISWQKVASMTEKPGRYQFTFGWLTVSAEDFFVAEKFPHAVFTLVKVASPADKDAEEFRLGAFELGAEFPPWN